MPNIFYFVDHSELSYSFCLLYGKRLGMDILLGDFNETYERFGTIKSEYACGGNDVGAYHKHSILADVNIRAIDGEEFLDTDIDYMLLTRGETIPMFENFRKAKPKSTFLCYTGNQGQRYPEHYHYIGVCADTYHAHTGKKTLILLETLPYFHFAPLEEKYRKTIRSFINYPSSDAFYKTILDFEIGIKEDGFDFLIHGNDGRDGGFTDSLLESDALRNSLGVLHPKTVDGYGFVIQHIAITGRAILTDFNYYEGRTLWPIVQTWGIDVNIFDGYQAAQKFKEKSSILDDVRMERQAMWCKDFFNYEEVADRVKKFLSNL